MGWTIGRKWGGSSLSRHRYDYFLPYLLYHVYDVLLWGFPHDKPSHESLDKTESSVQSPGLWVSVWPSLCTVSQTELSLGKPNLREFPEVNTLQTPLLLPQLISQPWHHWLLCKVSSTNCAIIVNLYAVKGVEPSVCVTVVQCLGPVVCAHCDGSVMSVVPFKVAGK